MTEKRKISELTEVTSLGEQDELVLVHYDSGPVGPVPTGTTSIDFTVDGDDWTGDASDYSLLNTPDDVITARETIPDYGTVGMRLSGDNESDDLFVYIRKK